MSDPNPSTPALIGKKASGLELSERDIASLVASVSDDSMDDAQLGAFLMAVFIKGMELREVVALTKAMRDSGSVLKWPPTWCMGDKHSTGGVGDKVSLPLTPALAACGLKVPMISGRGLMHTGGTLDKLECIPGFNAKLTESEFLKALETAGCAITGQTKSLVPADRRMYAARDVSGTVPSLPLIVSSILSKKAAESLDALVLDVKYGEGSFLKTLEEAEKIARVLVDTMNAMGTKTTCVITTMNYPIGRTIGNALEVKESLECLSGGGPEDLKQIVEYLGGELLSSSGLSKNSTEGREAIAKALADGSAMRTFKEMLVQQNVSEEIADKLCFQPKEVEEILPNSKFQTPVTAQAAGTIVGQKALVIGEVSAALGAGRQRFDDTLDYSAGITLKKVVGEEIQEGECWAVLHHNTNTVSTALLQKIQNALVVDDKKEPFQMPSRIVNIFN